MKVIAQPRTVGDNLPDVPVRPDIEVLRDRIHREGVPVSVFEL
jgi:hypothetical protein